MNTEKSILTRFAAFLRPYFPPGKFKVLVQQWPYLRAVVTPVSEALEKDGTPHIDVKRLLDSLEGVVIGRQDDEIVTVIEGQFEGHKCRLTIVLELLVPTEWNYRSIC